MRECWKPVAGYEGRYEVSNQGRVHSLARTAFNGHATHALQGRMLVQSVGGHGYRCVELYSGNGLHTKYNVHRLVAQAFIPNPLNKPEVNHKKGKQIQNNAVSNLEWATAKENTDHAFATGLNPRGEDRAQAKLNDKAVRAIRQVGARRTQRSLAEQWGVSPSLISVVLSRRTWKHVK